MEKKNNIRTVLGNTFSKRFVVLIFSVILVSSFSSQIPISYAESESTQHPDDVLLTQYENGLITSVELKQKLEELGWSERDIVKIFGILKGWTDPDTYRIHSEFNQEYETFTLSESLPENKAMQHADDVIVAQFENNLITQEELIQKLRDKGWVDEDIRKILGTLRGWVDTHTLEPDSSVIKKASVTGDEVSTVQPIKFGNELSSDNQVSQISASPDPRTPDFKSPTFTSSESEQDSPQDLVVGMVIAGIILVVGLVVGLLKKGII